MAALLGDDFVKGLHAKADIDPENRYIVHFPEDNTIMSVNSGYGGNVLLGKKCFALRIASYLGRQQGWMAEHMLILGLENPQGEVRYLAAAFPSACGKTNLAMLIPPEHYREKGWKVWCVGDDIAWLRMGADGRLWAMNPEYGFFGVAPGTNEKSNPNALASTRKGTIFTNVVHNLDDNTVWWEGLDKNPPRTLWTGRATPGTARPPRRRAPTPTPASPPRPRTAPASPPSSRTPRACPSPPSSSAAAGPRPPPWSTRPGTGPTACSWAPSWPLRPPPPPPARWAWCAGIPWPCCPSAATTWPTTGSTGWIWARSWSDKPPKIFNVNWFRTDDEGNFIWPGFGDNMRVLEWIMKRAFNETDAVETAIGYQPKAEDINLEGLDISKETVEGLLGVDKDLWREEAKGIHEFYNKFDGKVPQELLNELAKLEENLK